MWKSISLFLSLFRFLFFVSIQMCVHVLYTVAVTGQVIADYEAFFNFPIPCPAHSLLRLSARRGNITVMQAPFDDQLPYNGNQIRRNWKWFSMRSASIDQSALLLLRWESVFFAAIFL